MRISQRSFGPVSSSALRTGWLAALALLPTMLALGTTERSAQAAEAAEDTATEAASAEPSTPTSTTTASQPEASPTVGKRAPAGGQPDETLVEPPQPPPAGVPPIPATLPPASQAPASYVEHLGPESFPGRLRGLYGGSLWLEPSFHGLQWPYMAHTGIGISGGVWNDNGYESIKRGQDFSSKPDQSTFYPDAHMFVQQARAVLRVTPTYVNGNFFVQGQIEAVGNLCQVQDPENKICTSSGTFSTDDLWLRFGQWNSWDVKVGRFEAWEIYHLGMGLDQYTIERLGAGMFNPSLTPKLEAPSLYGVSYLHDRPTDGLATGYAAFHWYMTEYLRLEVLGKMGNDSYRADNTTNSSPFSYYGGRPTLILDLGWLKLKGGAEYAKRATVNQTQDQTGAKKDGVEGRVQKGVGGSVQVVVAPIVEFGLSAAIGKQEDTNGMGGTVPETSFTTKSAGGFANLRLADLWLLGVGAHFTSQTDQVLAGGNNNYTSQLQGFGAVQYLLAGQLFIKAVLAYGQAYFQPADSATPTWKNNMLSMRVRLMYLF